MRRSSAFLLILSTLFLLACDDDSSPGPGGGNGNGLPEGLIDPVWEYDHIAGRSITGGYVYRGSSLAHLQDRYIYADFSLGKIWALTYDGTNPPTNELLVDSGVNWSSLGVANDGRLYLVGWGASQSLYRLSGSFDIPTNTWSYSVVPAFGPFVRAVDLRNAGDGRLFVVEQDGTIEVFDPSVKPLATTTFLDISSKVTSGGELGLLGLAFHPNYASNGWFFVYYTSGSGPWTVHLSRFTVSGDPNVADAASEVELLSIPQQFNNHNGGGLAFEGNGYLLVGVGDEGSGGDPNDNGQDTTTLHGALLRLDVDVATAPYYQIPPDNPFAGNTDGDAEEIFAYGLRNPWRVSYDAATDRIWVGDVGQGRWEEIDIIVRGGNYGWDCREGAHPYTDGPGSSSPDCPEG